MRNFLKYIILIILATVALIGSANEFDSSIVESRTVTLSSEIDVHYQDSSKSYFDLYFPSQILGVNNVLRTPNTIKRTRNGYKNNFEFVKVGKVINTKIDNLVQEFSFNHYHRFVKSVSWLISLGKLVI